MSGSNSADILGLSNGNRGNEMESLINQMDEGLAVKFTEEELREAGKNFEKTLAVKLIGDRLYNRAAFKSVIRELWNPGTGLSFTEVEGDVFLVKFRELVDMERVLTKGPWRFMGRAIQVEKWSPGKKVSELFTGKLQIWVQIHNLPVEYRDNRFATRFAAKAGKVIRPIDDKMELRFNDGVKKYVKYLVEIDLDRAIVPGWVLDQGNLTPLWIEFKYEKLPNLCFNCGKFTHETRQCPTETASQLSKKKFGPWLRADHIAMERLQNRRRSPSPEAPSPSTTPVARMEIHQENSKNQPRVQIVDDINAGAETEECINANMIAEKSTQSPKLPVFIPEAKMDAANEESLMGGAINSEQKIAKYLEPLKTPNVAGVEPEVEDEASKTAKLMSHNTKHMLNRNLEGCTQELKMCINANVLGETNEDNNELERERLKKMKGKEVTDLVGIETMDIGDGLMDNRPKTSVSDLVYTRKTHLNSEGKILGQFVSPGKEKGQEVTQLIVTDGNGSNTVSNSNNSAKGIKRRRKESVKVAVSKGPSDDESLHEGIVKGSVKGNERYETQELFQSELAEIRDWSRRKL